MRGRAHALGLVILVLAAAATPVAAMAPGGLCATVASQGGEGPRVAVLSAFPAELAPLVAAAVVQERVDVGGREFYLGELGGVRVVLGLLGIGMVNAATTAESVLARFDVAGVVVSGVAGSPRRIADVTVPKRWIEESTGTTFRAHPGLVALARRARSDATLERCTPVPPPAGPTVCLAHEPRIFVGGRGQSGDPFGGPLACQPGGGDVFGCELPEPVTAAAYGRAKRRAEPVAVDMETAAVARVAADHGVPFVAFRAVSDGAGDPLDLPGFPEQFFAYYPLAAKNAAGGTIALLERVARVGGGRHPRRRLCRRLAGPG